MPKGRSGKTRGNGYEQGEGKERSAFDSSVVGLHRVIALFYAQLSNGRSGEGRNGN